MRYRTRGLFVAASILCASALNPAFANIGSVPIRVMLRGIGGISPRQGESCDATTCPGTLRVNLYVGTPEELQGQLVIPFTAGKQPDPITQCLKVSGTGTLRDAEYVATFVGELCGQLSIRYSLSGSLEVHTNTPTCANQNEVAAVGTLQMFGAVKSIGNGIPYASSGLASFMGTAARMVICGP